MALNDLSNTTLLAILDEWLNETTLLPTLRGLKRCSVLIDDITAARDDLRSKHAVSRKLPAALAKVQQKALGLDRRHDRWVRGFAKIAEGLTDLVDDPELAEQLATAVQEVLGPQGTAIAFASYTDEAANAALADQRISSDTKSLLETIVFRGKNFVTYVGEWQSTAADLGAADKERLRLEAEAKKALKPQDAKNARNACINLMTTFLRTLDLDAPDADTREKLHRMLDNELAKAAKRARSSGGAEDGEEAAEETTDPEAATEASAEAGAASAATDAKSGDAKADGAKPSVEAKPVGAAATATSAD